MGVIGGHKRESLVVPINTDTGITLAHHQRILDVTAGVGGDVTITVPAAGSLPDGFECVIRRNPASANDVVLITGVIRTLTEDAEGVMLVADSGGWIYYPTMGPAGATGAAGPNKITASTDTNLTGTLRGNGSTVSATKDKLAASTAPTVDDDSGDGYAVGSRWADTTAKKEYVCLNATVGAAVWKETTQSGSSFVGAKVKRTSNQTISNSTMTVVSWNAEDFDTDSMHDNSTNPSRVTIATGKGGKYLCVFTAIWGSNNTGARQVGFYIDGGQGTDVIFPNSGIGEDHNQIVAVLELSAGQYVEAFVWQASGGSLDLQYINGCSLSVIKVG